MPPTFTTNAPIAQKMQVKCIIVKVFMHLVIFHHVTSTIYHVYLFLFIFWDCSNLSSVSGASPSFQIKLHMICIQSIKASPNFNISAAIPSIHIAFSHFKVFVACTSFLFMSPFSDSFSALSHKSWHLLYFHWSHFMNCLVLLHSSVSLNFRFLHF